MAKGGNTFFAPMYNPVTGIITGQRGVWSRVDSKGYICGRYLAKMVKGHRYAWYVMTGNWPQSQLDHINGNRSDNRWCNLREALPNQNAMNRKIRNDNLIGHKNITYRKEADTYRINITANKIRVIDIHEKDLELAILIAEEGRDKYHGLFAKHN